MLDDRNASSAAADLSLAAPSPSSPSSPLAWSDPAGLRFTDASAATAYPTLAAVHPTLAAAAAAAKPPDGRFTTGSLMAFLLYTVTIAGALGGIAGLFSSIMNALGASVRIFELLDRPTAIPARGGRKIADLRGEPQLRTWPPAALTALPVLTALCVCAEPTAPALTAPALTAPTPTASIPTAPTPTAPTLTAPTPTAPTPTAPAPPPPPGYRCARAA